MSEEVKLRFDEIKKKKSYRYVVFFIKDERSIAVETTGKTNFGYCASKSTQMFLL